MTTHLIACHSDCTMSWTKPYTLYVNIYPICTMSCRHRLVVPKYNPARTFTEEGTVGLGGAYMCIYPMDSPGGYQLVGRTLPIWNTWGRVKPFTPDAPWLLRIFDQVWVLKGFPGSSKLVTTLSSWLLGSSKLVSTLINLHQGLALLPVPLDHCCTY